jgi:Cys-tRNA(Pro) deacylase
MTTGRATPATRLLRESGVAFVEHEYRYEPHGGTRVSARALAVDEHAVVKTLVLEDDDHEPLIVLMHGDREVSLKALARQIGRRAVQMCAPQTAQRHTGYMVGGTSPFGTRKKMRVFVERSIIGMDRIYLNGGARGFLIEIDPADLGRVLDPTPVDVALSTD